MRRTAGVPRGLLRFLVTKFLKEKPMSGAEIVDEIEKETGGRWKPSPGSIYPLLAWLQDKGYTRELPKEEDGMKRYELTEEGIKFFEDQIRFGEKLRGKLEFLAPMILCGFHLEADSKKLAKIREPAKRLVKALLDLRLALIKNGRAHNLTEQNVKEVVDILNASVAKLEGIIETIKKG